MWHFSTFIVELEKSLSGEVEHENTNGRGKIIDPTLTGKVKNASLQQAVFLVPEMPRVACLEKCDAECEVNEDCPGSSSHSSTLVSTSLSRPHLVSP